jgi:hypothetical protein
MACGWGLRKAWKNACLKCPSACKGKEQIYSIVRFDLVKASDVLKGRYGQDIVQYVGFSQYQPSAKSLATILQLMENFVLLRFGYCFVDAG